MENNDIKNKQQKADEMQDKLDKMRMILTDSEKCKEIAQKLCAYISSK